MDADMADAAEANSHPTSLPVVLQEEYPGQRLPMASGSPVTPAPLMN
jgi:hypothetical protein